MKINAGWITEKHKRKEKGKEKLIIFFLNDGQKTAQNAMQNEYNEAFRNEFG